MFNCFTKACVSLNTNLKLTQFLNSSPACIVSQTRNTFILKRRWPPGLTKKNHRPVLRGRHNVYDLIEDTNVRKRKNIDVILTSYVAGYGDKGDIVSVNSNYAYYHLLLPGNAVYATPENLSQFEELLSSSETRQTKFSSPTAERTVNFLSKLTLYVVMNKEESWELQPWHIRACFRKEGITVPESAIELPALPIRGPDLNLQDKEFFVHVTVNKRERVAVRCLLHHWGTQPADRLPIMERYWEQPAEPIFPKESSGA